MRNIQLKEKFWTFDSSNGEIEEDEVHCIYIDKENYNTKRYDPEKWEDFVIIGGVYHCPEDRNGHRLKDVYFSYEECFENARVILQKRIGQQELTTKALKEKYNL